MRSAERRFQVPTESLAPAIAQNGSVRSRIQTAQASLVSASNLCGFCDLNVHGMGQGFGMDPKNGAFDMKSKTTIMAAATAALLTAATIATASAQVQERTTG